MSCYKQCPMTSADVEHIFSKLKHLLSDKKTQFQRKKNLGMYMIIRFNKML